MTKSKPSFVTVLMALIKIKVVLPVSFLGFAGSYLYNGVVSLETWLACLGVLFLSSASSVWNQVMEQNYDQLMDRTRSRPLPSGNISYFRANIIAIVLLIAGSAALVFLSKVALLLGILAVIWYLYVYTLLKRKSAFATIPGALTGALPLLIGWVAAGGYVFDRYIIISSLFVFIWQIPHFWILMMVYGNDYQKAGFPVLTETFSFRNLKLWTLAWIVVLVVQASLLPIFLEISLNFTQILFIIPSIITLFYSSLKLLNEKNTEKRSLMPVFHILNSFMLLIVILLMVFRE